MARIALASATFSKVSETFIRAHALIVSESGGAILCSNREDLSGYGVPSLSGYHPSHLHRAQNRVLDAILVRSQLLLRRVLHGSRLRRSGALRVQQFLRENGIEVVLVEYLDHAVQYVDLVEKCGIRLLAFAHGADVNILGAKQSWRKRYSRAKPHIETVIANSEFMRSRLLSLGFDDRQICVVNPPVSEAILNQREEVARLHPEPTVVCVARLIPQKGIEQLIEAFKLVKLQVSPARLVIVGDGPERDRLQAAAESLGSSVVFTGAVSHDEVQRLMFSADVYAQHCVTLPGKGIESYGLSIVEAMAAGLPVVSTRHGAIPETVVHGQTGYLVAENDCQAMASHIVALLLDRNAARAIGQAGQVRVTEHYTKEIFVRRMSEVICGGG